MRILFIDVNSTLFKGNFIKIRVLLVLTSHNLSYVIYIKLKIEQKFDRNRINLLNMFNIDI